MFDVIVRGGRVVDPSQDLDAPVDVGITGPRIAACSVSNEACAVVVMDYPRYRAGRLIGLVLRGA